MKVHVAVDDCLAPLARLGRVLLSSAGDLVSQTLSLMLSHQLPAYTGTVAHKVRVYPFNFASHFLLGRSLVFFASEVVSAEVYLGLVYRAWLAGCRKSCGMAPGTLNVSRWTSSKRQGQPAANGQR
jgi:hypothetical protein